MTTEAVAQGRLTLSAWLSVSAGGGAAGKALGVALLGLCLLTPVAMSLGDITGGYITDVMIIQINTDILYENIIGISWEYHRNTEMAWLTMDILIGRTIGIYIYIDGKQWKYNGRWDDIMET